MTSMEKESFKRVDTYVSDPLCCTAETNTSLIKYTPKKKFFFNREPLYCTGFPGGSLVKNLPAEQETRDQSLGWKNLLEKEMATHFSILAWRIP